MLIDDAYIQLSLEYNLFWVRIMKEHAIFIEVSVPASQMQIMRQADRFKQQYERFLAELIRLSDGMLSEKVLESGQFVTPYTEASEQAVCHFTGVSAGSGLTRLEYDLRPRSPGGYFEQSEQVVNQLNRNLLNLTIAFSRFKSSLLESQTACELFTFLYTADLDHILREAMRYIDILNALVNRDEAFLNEYREFWNRNMAEHAMSMRGLFDPTEAALIGEANHFAQLFEKLNSSPHGSAVDEIGGTEAISRFKADTTQGLLECKIKAIMSPLFTDHLLREAKHYLFLLQSQIA